MTNVYSILSLVRKHWQDLAVKGEGSDPVSFSKKKGAKNKKVNTE